MTDATRPPLGTLGQVYVTARAAETYARDEGLRPEEARRELTEVLLTARVRDPAEEPMSVRARSRTSGQDVSATVAREGPLLVVLTATSRDYHASTGGAGARARRAARRHP